MSNIKLFVLKNIWVKMINKNSSTYLYFKRKWVCLISDPAIAKDYAYKLVMFDKIMPESIAEQHFGMNVVHSNGDHKLNNIYSYNEAQNVFRNPFFSLISIERIPILRQLAFRKIDRLNNLLEDIIKEKRKTLAAGQSNSDLLEFMLKACEDSNNSALSDIELRAITQVNNYINSEKSIKNVLFNTYTIFFLMNLAATALSTLLYLLAVHKVRYSKNAREEVLKILGVDLTPSAEQHASLKYLNMVIHESLDYILRLKYKNFLLPAGTFIGLFLYGIQNSSKLWENPEKFCLRGYDVFGNNIDQFGFFKKIGV
ncbi:9422_t:CDS:2 [Cetraspora pellucida]|uniref:9422_t:CDS:1 n=1 Tax=Cetraspora pellucida TaxID=1433469 RepID=A0ACA9KC95_9GLOM|nr:9422_t:CDS:2 [Cetraspora pellucida]